MLNNRIITFFITAIVVAVRMDAQQVNKINTTVTKRLSDKQTVEADARSLTLPEGYRKNLKWNLVLDSVGEYGSLISWRSGNPSYISNNGTLLKRSSQNSSKVKVKLTATISAGTAKRTKSFDVIVAHEEPKFDGYLFAYFEGQGPGSLKEHLRFGVSSDALKWGALNNNQPVVHSDTISGTGGIRDPHILRGEEDYSFYLVSTDMSTHKNGWDYNPGIVMLQSNNLIDWKHSVINLEKSYPKKFAGIKWVWAPQTIYDPAAGKYLIYFTVRYKDDLSLDFYGAYANKDFTGFESEPSLLFKPKHGGIDGDIIYHDGLYHFFYKGNTKNTEGKEVQNGIQQATSKTLQGPWTEDFNYVDAYSSKHVSVEGSGIFKLNNSETYILMYDLYRDHRYEFQRSTDLFQFSDTPESFTKNFNPRHGTVISITKEEAKRLNDKWGGVPATLVKPLQ
ncbi:MAG TPA: glycoside hydrolase family 43 protein [Chitinophagaceae bacterium]|nr:glycoside hydrolase family 43 protein [Chitinophagaceae bacterium]